MNHDDIALLEFAGFDPGTRLSKTDAKLWLAYARLAAGDASRLRDETNRRLLAAGRLEYGEAALAREAPASRNTIAGNRERLAPLLEGLAGLEGRRKAAEARAKEEQREERRSAAEKDRVIDQQASVIAAQMVRIHGLERRIEAMTRRAVRPDSPSPPLGRHRPRARASAPPDRGANRAAQ